MNSLIISIKKECKMNNQDRVYASRFSIIDYDIIITKFSVKFSSDLYFVSYIYIYIFNYFKF